ncbi:hypothetical protein BOX15_Mlig013321g4 [Macrostomum lignano]|uniref:Thioredoxin domain-containing protein n=1 Tax=Macrostomum lignano TaxID=282301 RepID=A0A267H3L4_9PLAT|nr:hypothetical protein BOX15_Mlig013321g1 [Macrostomum lignano]PAA85089.1 hypothetical protein BOX15_Mlig013321g3 [Macrostomum lignano]PAA92873.1 hypothetical protein BOX15_Mlig013321g4 [Macrostomum lignano]
MTLAWVTSQSVYDYKYSSNRVEVLLYSAQTCQICQGKLVPIFQELSGWSSANWQASGLQSSVPMRLSALDTSNNPRPNIAEAQDISNVPYVQMWAPTRLKYAPLSLAMNFQDAGYNEIRARLIEWIVTNVNNI